MLVKWVIEELDSFWSFLIVLVNKKENLIRFCIDFRKFNEIIIKDSYFIFRIELILDVFLGLKYYFIIDLKSGYL